MPQEYRRFPRMSLRRRHVPDPAVAVLLVVPLHEALHPCSNRPGTSILGAVGPSLYLTHAHTQFLTGLLPPRPGGHGFINQVNSLAAIWSADQSSSSFPQIASAFFRSTSSAAASVKAALSRLRSCAVAFACSQATRYSRTCSTYSPLLRQYSASSDSLSAALSSTTRNFS